MRKSILFSFLLLFGLVQLSALEYSGSKLEYMNVENTGFYGFGIFASNRRFDAEVEIFAAHQVFSGGTDRATFAKSSYKTLFYSFSGYFHFIRTDTMSYYIGTGIFPFLPRSYAYHFTAGLDFSWGENWRVYYNYRILFNNAASYRYPSGSAFAAGIKYIWYGAND